MRLIYVSLAFCAVFILRMLALLLIPVSLAYPAAKLLHVPGGRPVSLWNSKARELTDWLELRLSAEKRNVVRGDRTWLMGHHSVPHGDDLLQRASSTISNPRNPECLK